MEPVSYDQALIVAKDINAHKYLGRWPLQTSWPSWPRGDRWWFSRRKDEGYPADRTYLTTPSTFPNPTFPTTPSTFPDPIFLTRARRHEELRVRADLKEVRGHSGRSAREEFGGSFAMVGFERACLWQPCQRWPTTRQLRLGGYYRSLWMGDCWLCISSKKYGVKGKSRSQGVICGRNLPPGDSLSFEHGNFVLQ